MEIDCPFCALGALVPAPRFAGDLVAFVQDERFQGALRHSGVIVPIRHCTTVFDLTEEEIVATFRLLAVVKQWMDTSFAPEGYNIGWNCGRIGGQDVFHAHLHVIPRFAREPLAGRGIRAHLKAEANRW